MLSEARATLLLVPIVPSLIERNYMYVLQIEGEDITEPMPLHEIVATWGSVQLLESKGFIVVKV